MCRRSTEARRSKNSRVGVAAEVLLVGGAHAREKLRERVDRDGPPGLESGLRDQHREGVLPVPTPPGQPQAAGPRRDGRRAPRRSSPIDLQNDRVDAVVPGDLEAHVPVAGAVSPSRRLAPAGAPGGRSRHSQGRATSSGPRIQPEPSQTPSGQAGSGVDRARQPHRSRRGAHASSARSISRAAPSPAVCSIGRSEPRRAVDEARILPRGRPPARPRWARCGAWRRSDRPRSDRLRRRTWMRGR